MSETIYRERVTKFEDPWSVHATGLADWREKLMAEQRDTQLMKVTDKLLARMAFLSGLAFEGPGKDDVGMQMSRDALRSCSVDFCLAAQGVCGLPKGRRQQAYEEFGKFVAIQSERMDNLLDMAASSGAQEVRAILRKASWEAADEKGGVDLGTADEKFVNTLSEGAELGREAASMEAENLAHGIELLSNQGGAKKPTAEETLAQSIADIQKENRKFKMKVRAALLAVVVSISVIGITLVQDDVSKPKEVAVKDEAVKTENKPIMKNEPKVVKEEPKVVKEEPKVVVKSEPRNNSPKNMKEVSDNMANQLEGMLELMSMMGYLMGVGFGIRGALAFKEHNENPQQVPLSKPITMMVVSGMMLALPNMLKEMPKAMDLPAPSSNKNSSS